MAKTILKNCKQCNELFKSRIADIKKGYGKFCSRSCSAQHNNQLRERSEESKRKTSESLQRWWEKQPNRQELLTAQGIKSQQGKHKTPESLFDLSNRTKSKVIKRMNLSCSRCGWDKVICDIHHIVPKSKDGSDKHDNLTYLCPNCHRLADNNIITDFVTLDEQIGDNWKKFYFG